MNYPSLSLRHDIPLNMRIDWKIVSITDYSILTAKDLDVCTFMIRYSNEATAEPDYVGREI